MTRERKLVTKHFELDVYKLAFEAAMEAFRLSRQFPAEERYALADQIRRSLRSVCANVTEAWRRRRYEASFVLRLNDSEAEAAETQTWIQSAVECGYLHRETVKALFAKYDDVTGMLVRMIANEKDWALKKS